MPTIFAPITAIGKSGVVTIRISGTDIKECLKALGINKLLVPRQATLCYIYDIRNDELLDKSLVTFFKSPYSFTGEDILEVSIHCSDYIIKRVFNVLSSIQNVKFANPGEFSKIAFLNNKLDLLQAEAILDLINSETEEQHKQAFRQLEGGPGKVYSKWIDELASISANIETLIDFSDEDLSIDTSLNIEKKINLLVKEISLHLEDDRKGEKIRKGLSLIIIGPPNVGKSSLLNYLANSDIAIVSDIVGTTRDVINTNLLIAGIPVIVSDTAGIRETEDCIEKEGIRRAFNRLNQSDIVIFIVDIFTIKEIKKNILDLSGKCVILLVNKIDINDNKDIYNEFKKYNPLFVSIKHKFNLDELHAILEDTVASKILSGQSPLITRERHRIYLKQALDVLINFSLDKDIELLAEDLRIAIARIGEITGKIGTEDILDKIFSQFCIGK